ncbi:MAG: hypothetical protein R3B06_21330 [Kofleriaceae bacterium]
MRYFLSTATPGHKLWRRPGMIPAKALREVADQALQAEAVDSFTTMTSRETRPDSRHLDFERRVAHTEFGMTHGGRPLRDDAQSWVDEVVTFFDRVGGGTGVIVAMGAREEVVSECSGCTISNNGQVQHPYPKQLARMRGLNSEHMGTRYMRFPRWGTLVSHEHVAQLGGVGAICAAVAPAVVRELSGGVYFQLTDSLATARSEEFVTKRKLFTDFAAPLLPPPQPPR